MRIAVYTIVKDEVGALADWSGSVGDADHLSVTDTGSSDGTPELAASLGVAVNHVRIAPFHFGDARNAALDALPEDIDIAVSMDADQRAAPGWRAAIERAVTDPGWSAQRLLAPAIREANGSCYRVPRIHARHGVRWRDRIHEYLADPSGLGPLTCEMELRHERDTSRSRSHFLELLQMQYYEDPTPRHQFYYARELMYAGQFDESVRRFGEYLANPEAKFAAERATACLHVARMRPGPMWPMRSIAEYPDQKEAYWLMAQHWYQVRDWYQCYAMAHSAMARPSNPFFPESVAAPAEIADMIALAAFHIGHKTDAVAFGRQALAAAPGDGRLRANVEHYESM